ncbi:Uncharacterized protein APZ42_033408 [Daphnia magna]|uniref:Integrase catalytic domain-containing protein n=1 Tax=Daphnia magna TaxID=35525 RepID=A0A164L4L5_9CRUS|nr:Uncharacterized protein APZ42_033408 [Daphnia magna]
MASLQKCTSCEPCALGRRVHNVKGYLNPLAHATRPFDRLGLDFLGPIKPHSFQGNNYILVITDYIFKWIEVISFTNCTAVSTSKALVERIILHHGPPKTMITDHDSNFTSELFFALYKALNVKRRKTTAYHPQTNGQKEWFNKTVVEMIRKYVENEFERWEDILGPFVFAYNNSVHSSTLKIPYFLNHGRDPAIPIDRFLRPLSPVIVTPSDYQSQIMKLLHEALQHVKIFFLKSVNNKKPKTEDELNPPPLTPETSFQSQLEQETTPCEKETPTPDLMSPSSTITLTPNFLICSRTIPFHPKPIPESSILPTRPKRHLGLCPLGILKPVVKSKNFFCFFYFFYHIRITSTIFKPCLNSNCCITSPNSPHNTVFCRLNAFNITICNCKASRPKGFLKLTNSDDCDYQISPLPEVQFIIMSFPLFPKSPILLVMPQIQTAL